MIARPHISRNDSKTTERGAVRSWPTVSRARPALAVAARFVRVALDDRARRREPQALRGRPAGEIHRVALVAADRPGGRVVGRRVGFVLVVRRAPRRSDGDRVDREGRAREAALRHELDARRVGREFHGRRPPGRALVPARGEVEAPGEAVVRQDVQASRVVAVERVLEGQGRRPGHVEAGRQEVRGHVPAQQGVDVPVALLRPVTVRSEMAADRAFVEREAGVPAPAVAGRVEVAGRDDGRHDDDAGGRLLLYDRRRRRRRRRRRDRGVVRGVRVLEPRRAGPVRPVHRGFDGLREGRAGADRRAGGEGRGAGDGPRVGAIRRPGAVGGARRVAVVRAVGKGVARPAAVGAVVVEAAALGVADAAADLVVFEIEGRGRAAPEDEVAAPAWKDRSPPVDMSTSG